MCSAIDGTGGLFVEQLTSLFPTSIHHPTSTRGADSQRACERPLSVRAPRARGCIGLSSEHDDFRLPNNPLSSVVRQRAETARATLGGVRAKGAFVAEEKQTIASNGDVWVECLFRGEKFSGHAEFRNEPEEWQ